VGRALKRAGRAAGRGDGGLERRLSGGAPDVRAPVGAERVLAVDLERSGLDPSTEHIISIGWIPIDGRAIKARGAGHVYVCGQGRVGQSATIHGVRDQDLEGGETLEGALAALLEALEGRALLVHHAPLDTGFIDRACREVFGGPLMPHVVDTVVMARAKLERAGLPMPAGTYRLGALRERYGLPRYGAHDALTDALATAELYLAMTAGQSDATLRDFLA